MSTTGGHLGAGLGVVELTVALHHVFETPKDVVFVDSLPQTVGGKVLKYKLRVTFASHYENAEAILPG